MCTINFRYQAKLKYSSEKISLNLLIRKNYFIFKTIFHILMYISYLIHFFNF